MFIGRQKNIRLKKRLLPFAVSLSIVFNSLLGASAATGSVRCEGAYSAAAHLLSSNEKSEQNIWAAIDGDSVDTTDPLFAQLPADLTLVPTDLLSEKDITEIEGNAYDVIEKAVDGLRLRRVSPTISIDDSVNAIEEWANTLPNAENPNRTLTVREHIALSYLLRSGFLNDFPDSSLVEKIKSSLSLSWTQKTGEARSGDAMLERLPIRVLGKASRQDQIFHAASYQIADPKTGRVPFALGKDYVPKAQDFAAAVALVAAAFTSTGRVWIARAVMLYGVGTIAEHVMHRYVGHASVRLLKIYENAGWLGRVLIETFAGHALVHHLLANTDYTNATAPTNERDRQILERRYAKYPGLKKNMETTDHGMTLNHESVLSIFMATLPVTFTMSMFTGFGFFPSLLSAMVPTLLISGASKLLHPFLHPESEDALANSSGILNYILRTRFAEYISALHYVHHNGGVAANYNLVPGGDYIAKLFAYIFNSSAGLDALTKPNLKMVMDMGKQGIIGGVRRDTTPPDPVD